MSKSVPHHLADSTIESILRRWPGAARVFLRHGMACVGCPMAPFESVAEAAREYHVELDVLLSDFEARRRGRCATTIRGGNRSERDAGGGGS